MNNPINYDIIKKKQYRIFFFFFLKKKYIFIKEKNIFPIIILLKYIFIINSNYKISN